MDHIKMKLLSFHSFHWSLYIMEKEIRKFVVVISTSLVASCAEIGALEVKNDNMSVAPKSIETFVDHDGLARRYENRAGKLLVMAAKHEKLLQHYEDKSYLYGRHGQDSQSHAIALVRKYKLAAEKASQAAFHQRMASELTKRNYAVSGVPH
jgi:hypothetical protein